MKNKYVSVEAFVAFATLSLDEKDEKVEELLNNIFEEDLDMEFDEIYYQSMLLELALFRLQVNKKDMSPTQIEETIKKGVEHYLGRYEEERPTLLSLGHYLKNELYNLFKIYLDLPYVWREEVMSGIRNPSE